MRTSWSVMVTPGLDLSPGADHHRVTTTTDGDLYMADSLKINKGDAISIHRDHTSDKPLFSVSISPKGGGIVGTAEGAHAQMTLEEAFDYIRSKIEID